MKPDPLLSTVAQVFLKKQHLYKETASPDFSFVEDFGLKVLDVFTRWHSVQKRNCFRVVLRSRTKELDETRSFVDNSSFSLSKETARPDFSFFFEDFGMKVLGVFTRWHSVKKCNCF